MTKEAIESWSKERISNEICAIEGTKDVDYCQYISLAWPIILREEIDIISPRPYVNNSWQCQIIGKKLSENTVFCLGEDPLVEAMRCFLKKKLTDQK
jgi:hypothetical protein